MAIEKDNDCVGCEHCIGCGRGNYYSVTCDECGDASERFVEIDDDLLCFYCFKDTLEHDEDNDLYAYDGSWYNHQALWQLFKEIGITREEILERFEED